LGIIKAIYFLLGTTQAKKQVKEELGVTDALKPFRWWTPSVESGIRSVQAAALLLILSVLWPSGAAGAENWPAWRGPRGDGSSLEKNLPDRWNGPRGENIVWKVG